MKKQHSPFTSRTGQQLPEMGLVLGLVVLVGVLGLTQMGSGVTRTYQSVGLNLTQSVASDSEGITQQQILPDALPNPDIGGGSGDALIGNEIRVDATGANGGVTGHNGVKPFEQPKLDDNTSSSNGKK